MTSDISTLSIRSAARVVLYSASFFSILLYFGIGSWQKSTVQIRSVIAVLFFKRHEVDSSDILSSFSFKMSTICLSCFLLAFLSVRIMFCFDIAFVPIFVALFAFFSLNGPEIRFIYFVIHAILRLFMPISGNFACRRTHRFWI